MGRIKWACGRGVFVTQVERGLASGRLGCGAGRRQEDTVDWAGEREGCAGAGGPGVGCVGCGFGGVPVRGWPQGYRKVLSASSNEANLSAADLKHHFQSLLSR